MKNVRSFRAKPVGWRNESYRHYLAAKGVRTKRYYAYSPTFVPSDLSVISTDAVGTAGSSVVPWIPVVVPIAMVYGGAKYIKKRKEKTGSYFNDKDMVSFSPADLQAFDAALAEAKAKGKDQFMFKGRPVLVSFGKYVSEYLHSKFDEQYFARKRANECVLKRMKPGKVGQAAGIPIKAEKVEEGRVYPVSPDEVKAILKRAEKDTLKGIKSVEFINPKGEQKEAWGQFVRSKKKIYIFSQPSANCMIDGQPAAQVRRHIKEYVIPHEIGHHRALRGGKTDKSIALAEARADANVVGLSPFDRDVVRLVRR